MKKTAVVAIATLFAATTGFCQSDSIQKLDSMSVEKPQGIHFTYSLPSQPKVGDPVIKASGDSIVFELTYVDAVCDGYEYLFEQKKNLLLIKRVNPSCDKDNDQLYAINGTLRNVPRGNYTLELLSVVGKKMEVLYSESVKVK